MARETRLPPLADVDLRLLRVFRAVAGAGGLAAAEPELGIGRSTISRHLSDLETRLGLTLARRGPAGFSLTPEGTRTLEATERLLAAIGAFRGEIEEAAGSLGGTLRLAAFDLSSSNPEARVDLAIGAFGERAPGVALEVSVAPPEEIASGLLAGRLDVGLVPPHGLPAGLEHVELYAEPVVLCCGARHPLHAGARASPTADALRAHRGATLGPGSANALAAHRLGLECAARAENEEALALLILSGRYLGFLPEHVAARFVDAGRMRLLAPGRTRYVTPMGAVVRRRPASGRRTALFLECLAEAHGRAPGRAAPGGPDPVAYRCGAGPPRRADAAGADPAGGPQRQSTSTPPP